MKYLILTTFFIYGCISFGQIKPKTNSPDRFIPENVIEIPTKNNQVEIPKNTTPKRINIVPTLYGKWTNANKNMLYIYKENDVKFFFVSEEKVINPLWTIIGTAKKNPDGTFKFEYGYAFNKNNTGFDNWIFEKDLKGSFMDTRGTNVWKKYSGPLVRSKKVFSPPTPKAGTSVLVGPLSFSNTYTDSKRQIMWHVNNAGDKIFMLGETVDGVIQFIGIGTRTKQLNTKYGNTYQLDMNLVNTIGPNDKTVNYKFMWDSRGISYLNSSDCYNLEAGSYPRPDGITFVCPDGMVSGMQYRMIPLHKYDLNRTANVASNIQKNQAYFKYTPPSSPYKDPRLSENNDKDNDGHGYIGAYNCTFCDDCDDNDPNRFPGNSEVADMNGYDEDCNYETIGKLDRDGDGHTDYRVTNIDEKGNIRKSGDDCNDNDPDIYEGRIETCDGKDNNCDGNIDEGLLKTQYYRDEDGDGLGNPDVSRGVKNCYQPDGYVSNSIDCDDSDKSKKTNCN
ncbi:putative metal-binding motif-containing protein [Aequorivita todarodis]|uniref:putative metal-binding motif-containing protein n=1 Tax=Aequorivita todarodis TaxID=2036821 RepID=UPI0023503735|nr:putative metal-binding motif-containing protein [Aequorivita todarodis]MDC8000034.1 putative metal-binding motif-containing protein [Aequorivita todarodis]